MNIQFSKYHGAGNDFVLIDNRVQKLKLSNEQIAFLCNRHLGIGADGLMLLETEPGSDFRMVYYNADGRESSMCGNGGRCITAFAHDLGLFDTEARFTAIDGVHKAILHTDGSVSLDMIDVDNIRYDDGFAILNTGSPHYIRWVTDLNNLDVVGEGRALRNRPEYQPDGINVNFVARSGNAITVRTYERGVEDETLSCGTGVTAAAIASTALETGTFNILVNTPGGILEVSFVKDAPLSAGNIVLKGPAQLVFKGHIEL